eukprot:CAMPEP_0172035902 /NCGR_PEP_ID=MMETSP1041-20130122/21857_1 /TAXON_ID=464988 /ORGANISM="Hemiselmis andersenii, Strain CCMP439" /LENGTH=151 /DNA_ID=CAMNT_0012693053 /DNA_START=23 /DNA_END=475 /DNA_ORIENTATION=+
MSAIHSLIGRRAVVAHRPWLLRFSLASPRASPKATLACGPGLWIRSASPALVRSNLEYRLGKRLAPSASPPSQPLSGHPRPLHTSHAARQPPPNFSDALGEEWDLAESVEMIQSGDPKQQVEGVKHVLAALKGVPVHPVEAAPLDEAQKGR